MIVRILGEGQYELGDEAAVRVEKLDDDLGHALAANDPEWFDRALAAILAEVRESGTPVGESTFVPSDRALPPEGSSMDEVRELLSNDSSGA